MINRVCVGAMSLSLSLLGASCGAKKDAKSPQAAPIPETTTTNPEGPTSTASAEVTPGTIAEGRTYFRIPPGLSYTKTSCKDGDGEYTFSSMLFYSSTCEFTLDATSNDFDLADWAPRKLHLENRSPVPPMTAWLGSLNLEVDKTQRRLLLSTYFLTGVTPNSKLHLSLQQKSTKDVYVFSLEVAQKNDLFESAAVSPSQVLTISEIAHDGATRERKALLRTDASGIPVVRASEMIAFDLQVKTGPGVKLYGLPAGGKIQLKEKYQGIGSFFDDQDKVNRHAILAGLVPFTQKSDAQLHAKTIFAADHSGSFPHLSQYRDEKENDAPVLYRGLVEGTFTSITNSGHELATTPFKFRMVDAALDQDLEVRVKRDPADTLGSVSIENVADYDLRPLILEFDMECNGRMVHHYAAISMDPHGQWSHEQTTRMLPGDVWTITALDILQALAQETSRTSDSSASNGDQCLVGELTMSVREMSYLSTLRLGAIMPIEQGRKIKINLGTPKG